MCEHFRMDAPIEMVQIFLITLIYIKGVHMSSFWIQEVDAEVRHIDSVACYAKYLLCQAVWIGRLMFVSIILWKRVGFQSARGLAVSAGTNRELAEHLLLQTHRRCVLTEIPQIGLNLQHKVLLHTNTGGELITMSAMRTTHTTKHMDVQSQTQIIWLRHM